MSDRLERQRHDDSEGGALAEGLRQLSTPEVSAGFDERVLAAVRQPAPRRLPAWASWRMLRPVFAGAAVSLVAMLAIGSWLMRLPLDVPGASARGDVVATAVDREVDGIDSGTTLRPLFALRRGRGEERQEPRQPGS